MFYSIRSYKFKFKNKQLLVTATSASNSQRRKWRSYTVLRLHEGVDEGPSDSEAADFSAA